MAAHGNNPFQLDSRKIKGDLFKFLAKDALTCFKSCLKHLKTEWFAGSGLQENRFAAVMRRDPKHAQEPPKPSL